MRKIFFLLLAFLAISFSPCLATVSDTNSPVKVYTSGASTSYPIPFDYIDDEDIVVTLYDPDTGTEISQTKDVDYTIASDTVTYSTAPGSAYYVIIRRETPYTQESEFDAGSAPPLSTYESAYDKLTFLTQDLDERLQRALLQPESATRLNLTLPDPVYNAGKGLRINAGGTDYEAYELSSGVTINLSKLSDYDSVADMVSTVGATEKTIIVDTVGTLTGNTILPSTMHIIVLRGGAFATAGYTLRINGQFKAGRYQVFSGFSSGDVTYTTGGVVYPEWFGAVGDGVVGTPGGTDDTASIQAAVDSLPYGGTVQIAKLHCMWGTLWPGGTWNDCVALQYDNLIIEGVTPNAGFIQPALGDMTYNASHLFHGPDTGLDNITFRNLYFEGNGKDDDTDMYDPGTGSYLPATGGASAPIFMEMFSNVNIHDCTFYNFSLIAAFYGATTGNGQSDGLFFHHNKVLGTATNVPYTGVMLYYARNVWVHNNIFEYQALPFRCESFNGSGPYDNSEWHYEYNIIRHGKQSTQSPTNLFNGAGCQVTAGNEFFDFTIIGNTFVDCESSTTGNKGGGAIWLLGADTDIGNVHDGVVANNIVTGYTPVSGGNDDIGIYLQYCKNVTVTGNVLANPTAGAIMTGIRLTDSTECVVSNNIVSGTNYNVSIAELISVATTTYCQFTGNYINTAQSMSSISTTLSTWIGRYYVGSAWKMAQIFDGTTFYLDGGEMRVNGATGTGIIGNDIYASVKMRAGNIGTGDKTGDTKGKYWPIYDSDGVLIGNVQIYVP